MSDHWNSLANLLGTPNLAPRGKKNPEKSESTSSESDSAAIEAKRTPSNPPSDRKSEVEIQPNAQKFEDSEVEKAKIEEAKPSLLKSSWDALAGLFGMSSPSQDFSQTPVSGELQEASKGATESKSRLQDVKQRKSTEKSPESKLARSKESIPNKESNHRDRNRPSMWGNAAQEGDNAREGAAQVSAPQKLDPADGNASSPSTDASEEPNRRGPRRSPRRGREDSEAVDKSRRARNDSFDSSEVESTPEFTRDAERAGRRDRTDSRKNKADSQATERDTGKRDSLPSPRNKTSRGFGAGIESLDNHSSGSRGDSDFVRDQDDSYSVNSQPIETESTDRKVRSRGRDDRRKSKPETREREGHSTARNSEERSVSLSDDSRSEDIRLRDTRSQDEGENGQRVRQGKIPSWEETIGVLIAANKANHQKQSPAGRNRNRR